MVKAALQTESEDPSKSSLAWEVVEKEIVRATFTGDCCHARLPNSQGVEGNMRIKAPTVVDVKKAMFAYVNSLPSRILREHLRNQSAPTSALATA